MVPASGPTTAEIMRRLDEVVTRLDRLAAGLEEGYVRKDVQEAREIATAFQLKGFEDELHTIQKNIDQYQKQRENDRRLMYTLAVTVFLGPVIVALVLHSLSLK